MIRNWIAYISGRYGFHKVRTAIRFKIEQGKIKDLEVLELEK